jgi:hypothetical protein
VSSRVVVVQRSAKCTAIAPMVTLAQCEEHAEINLLAEFLATNAETKVRHRVIAFVEKARGVSIASAVMPQRKNYPPEDASETDCSGPPVHKTDGSTTTVSVVPQRTFLHEPARTRCKDFRQEVTGGEPVLPYHRYDGVGTSYRGFTIRGSS